MVSRDDGSIPTGRLRRTATPALLAARTAAAIAAAKARAMRGDSVAEIARDERLAAAATRVATSMGEMKGAVMKIGQLLSFVDSAMIPEAYREALTVLQADAPPMPFHLVEDVVTAELGAPPHEMFDWFSPKPIAAASIGQVHMAHLGDQELVVKVQYPGVAEAIAADLRNGALLSMLASLMQSMLRGMVGDMDTKALIAEVADRVGEELDYRIEAANQQRFVDLYHDHPTIHIPAVVHELSTERVLVSEYVDAMRWSAALQESQERRDQWGEAIARFVFGSLHQHHLFNADPHPGNYLFHEDGRVTFLDFGCVKEFDDATVASLHQFALAARSDDDEQMLDALMGTGVLKTKEGIDRRFLLDRIYNAWAPIRATQPYHYTRQWAEEQVADIMMMKLGKKERALLRAADMPPDQVFLLRINVGLNSVLAQLGCTIDWDDLGEELWGW